MNEYSKYDANEIPFHLLLILDPGTDIGVGSCLPIIHIAYYYLCFIDRGVLQIQQIYHKANNNKEDNIYRNKTQ